MQSKNKEKETIPIGTRITETMKKCVEKILLTDGHVNKADYVRDLIRKDLEQRGLLTSVFEKEEKEA
jgi:Arc/MetJ-type ribon-helix-helix transcriptional regulator